MNEVRVKLSFEIVNKCHVNYIFNSFILFPHDDTTNDRTSGSKLDVSFKNTQDLWKQAYNQNFFFSGGMFRGNPANDLYYLYL